MPALPSPGLFSCRAIRAQAWRCWPCTSSALVLLPLCISPKAKNRIKEMIKRPKTTHQEGQTPCPLHAQIPSARCRQWWGSLSVSGCFLRRSRRAREALSEESCRWFPREGPFCIFHAERKCPATMASGRHHIPEACLGSRWFEIHRRPSLFA